MVYGRDCGRFREIVRDYMRSWEIVVYITWYFLIAERGECFPEMLPRIGLVPSRRNGRKRWSEACLFGQGFLTIRLVLLGRSRPPFATSSSARDEPYTWEYLREAFSTLRYRNIHGYCADNQLLYLPRSLDQARNNSAPKLRDIQIKIMGCTTGQI